MSSFKLLAICSSKDEGPQYDVKTKIGVGVDIFRAMKLTLLVRSVSLYVRMELYENLVTQIVTYALEALGMR